jgi:hypothetical protein
MGVCPCRGPDVGVVIFISLNRVQLGADAESNWCDQLVHQLRSLLFRTRHQVAVNVRRDKWFGVAQPAGNNDVDGGGTGIIRKLMIVAVLNLLWPQVLDLNLPDRDDVGRNCA